MWWCYLATATPRLLCIVMHRNGVYIVLYSVVLHCIALYGGRTGWWVVGREVGGAAAAAAPPHSRTATDWYSPCRNRGLKRTFLFTHALFTKYICLQRSKVCCYGIPNASDSRGAS